MRLNRGIDAFALVVSGIATAFKWLGIAAMVTLITVASLDVLLRELTGRGIAGGIQVAELALAVVVFGGLGAAYVHRDHVTIDLAIDRLPRSAARVVEAVATVLLVIFLVWISYHTTLAALDSASRNENFRGIVALPTWPARAAIPLGFMITTLAALVHLVALIRNDSRAESDALQSRF